MMADPAANHGEGVRIPDDLHGFIEPALRGRNNVTRDIHPDGANFTAGGRPVDRGCIHHSGNLSVDHLSDEMALLMTSEAYGMGLHSQTFLLFPHQ
jgi:hypothetical protein